MPEENGIQFRVTNEGPEPILEIKPDGFYIRGEKVPADDKEAQAVYTAFNEWLIWSRLLR